MVYELAQHISLGLLAKIQGALLIGGCVGTLRMGVPVLYVRIAGPFDYSNHILFDDDGANAGLRIRGLGAVLRSSAEKQFIAEC